MNYQIDSEGVLHFEDFVQSSAPNNIGDTITIGIGGPYSVGRFKIVTKNPHATDPSKVVMTAVPV